MAIPPFREDGWLPSGHYAASWDEIVNRFYGVPGSRRAFLTAQLLLLRDTLLELGIRGYLLLDGSYISAKPEPNDFIAEYLMGRIQRRCGQRCDTV